jgi:hypothetical protein
VDFRSKFDPLVAPMSFLCTLDEVLQAKCSAKTVSVLYSGDISLRHQFADMNSQASEISWNITFVSRIMEKGWQFVTLYMGLLFLKLCGGFPIDLDSAGESYCKIA